MSGFLPDLTLVPIGGKLVECGTAAEIAVHLGPDVSAKRVHDWGQRGLIDRWNVPGQGRGTTYFRLDQAAEAEARTGTSTRGRRRKLDVRAVLA